jgi:nitroimidazol reductase NimA-like FMN-containing flavoprotein (pyridoxamine 5'-phosphate oxidase superfamily)
MAEMVDLSQAECQAYINEGKVGRLAFATPHGLRMVPLNYTANAGVIAFRTLAESELGRYGEGAEAAFEIDEVDLMREQGWSVVAYGRLERPSEADEVWDIHGWRNPTPWSGDERAFHLKLRWHSLTGRRLMSRRSTG